MNLKDITSPFPALPLRASLHACHFQHRTASIEKISTRWGILYLPDKLHTATNKRQSEFLAGRYCALRAGTAIGFPMLDIPVKENLSPEWPSGWVGSITHSGSTAACIIGKKSDFQGLGIDLEPVINANRSSVIKEQIGSDQEVRTLHSLEEERLGVTLLFSAKEALYKALAPMVDRFITFHEATCIAFDTECLTFGLSRQLQLALGGRAFIKVFYRIQGQRITTLCIIEKALRQARATE